MQIDFHKDFRKGLKNLTPNQKKKVGDVLELFENGPYDPQLRNHPLHGEHKDRRSIAAGGGLRLIFREENHYELVVFLAVGTHNQVY